MLQLLWFPCFFLSLLKGRYNESEPGRYYEEGRVYTRHFGRKLRKHHHLNDFFKTFVIETWGFLSLTRTRFPFLFYFPPCPPHSFFSSQCSIKKKVVRLRGRVSFLFDGIIFKCYAVCEASMSLLHFELAKQRRGACGEVGGKRGGGDEG